MHRSCRERSREENILHVYELFHRVVVSTALAPFWLSSVSDVRSQLVSVFGECLAKINIITAIVCGMYYCADALYVYMCVCVRLYGCVCSVRVCVYKHLVEKKVCEINMLNINSKYKTMFKCLNAFHLLLFVSEIS